MTPEIRTVLAQRALWERRRNGFTEAIERAARDFGFTFQQISFARPAVEDGYAGKVNVTIKLSSGERVGKKAKTATGRKRPR